MNSFLGGTKMQIKIADKQDMLIRELEHRNYNVVAVIQGLARMSEDLPSFETRLAALAKSYQHISNNHWNNLYVKDIIETSLKPFLSWVEMKGPNVKVGPSNIHNLTLILNELATNALKHGAWLDANGKVNLSWQEKGDSLKFCWKESGGPVITVPTMTNFGTKLIKASFPNTTIEYKPTGLVCHFEFKRSVV